MIKRNLKQNIIRCAGKNCKNKGSNKLKINFINRNGYFCHDCSAYLLKYDLALKINEDNMLEESSPAPSNICESFIPGEEFHDYS